MPVKCTRYASLEMKLIVSIILEHCSFEELQNLPSEICLHLQRGVLLRIRSAGGSLLKVTFTDQRELEESTDIRYLCLGDFV